MELSFLPRSLWVNDGKFQHHHLTDLFASVQVTRDLPLGAIFGPCILQNTFYDTIAFIALKSCDKRNKSYVFRVDAEAMNNSPLVLSWLSFIQAASNKDEQNMEAFLQSGQLYFRSLRNIRKEEELLVWYDAELCHLLGFNDIKTKTPSNGFKCMNCTETFKNENPYLAHCRFLCSQARRDFTCRELYEQKNLEANHQMKSSVTDFHNIARDLEHKKSSPGETAYFAQLRKRKHEETESSRSKKSILLEKSNLFSNENNIANISKDLTVVPDIAISVLKLNEDNYLRKKDLPGYKHSAFTEVKRAKEKIKEEKASDVPAANETGHIRTGQTFVETDSGLQSAGSAFSFVFPKGMRDQQKSAFCKPNKKTVNDAAAQPSQALSGPSGRLEVMSETITSNTVLEYSNLLGPGLLHGDMAGAQPMPASMHATCPFPYAVDSWTRSTGIQLQTTSSLTLLPPTYTSYGVSVQNWCAKCNLSFRMTSDLVFHMRSHHKKEFAAESQVRRREEKLTCPICHEYFRERHHLSRHMTSHN